MSNTYVISLCHYAVKVLVLNVISMTFNIYNKVGTMEYMAPEVLLEQKFSEKSDVFSFAISINEMITKTFPYSDCTQENPKAHTILDMNYSR